jgi:microcin C transport system substrate-binding protein
LKDIDLKQRFSITRISAIIAFSLVAGLAQADEDQWRHGDSLIGELKYGADFKHYDYVNPNAPKGGQLKRTAFGGYDTFNPFIVRGRAPVQLNYWGGLLYDRMMDQSMDQAGASYGMVAKEFRKAEDSSWAVYRINEKARWHDGEPIKPEDVIWSLKVLRENYPLWGGYFKNIESAEKTGDHQVTFKFDQKGNRELPHIIGDLVVLPQHWWEGTDADGNKRDITQPTTEPPLGSGPYKIGSYELGKFIEYELVEDYWAKDIPVRKGRYNFGSIRYTYFLNQNAMWEAFKKGNISDYRIEPDSQVQRWVNQYDFDAVKRGDVEQITFPTDSGQAFTGYFFNTRLDKFKDVRVREAITLLFDFETINKNLFFDKFKRTDSHFESGVESSGIPEGRELEILNAYKDKLPADLFTRPYALPDYSKSGEKRKLQRRALKLFKEAGFTFDSNRRLLDASGKQMSIEFISGNPESERYTNSFVESLKSIGIDASLRILDTAQYKARADNFDFDMASFATRQSLSPGNEQRDYWSTASADQPGSRNYAGIKDPMLDELVEKIILAPNRDELVALTHALDRILKWRYYAVPQWHNPDLWFAKWRQIQVPTPQPLYRGVDTLSFWIDEAIEAELKP